MNVNDLMEITFNIAYLVTIYILVIIMAVRYRKGQVENKKVGLLFIISFLFLAVGDTGHVGFRVIGYLQGGLEANKILLGAGSLSTALTVTVFYMLLMEIFRVYTGRKRGSLYWFVMIVGVIRIIFMLLPGNSWGEGKSLTYSYIRNAMLTTMGIIIAVLYLREGLQKKDRTLWLFAVYIFISYGFYLPVILFVHLVPTIGMLMIPKTCAYVAVAITGARRMFKRNS